MLIEGYEVLIQGGRSGPMGMMGEYDVCVITPEKVKFLTHIQTMGPINEPGVLQYFKQNKKAFVIDVESQVIHIDETPKV